MSTKSEKELIELETRFWQSMVDEDAETAQSLLTQPALMVSAHGTMKFDHAGYKKMAEGGTMVVKSFKFSDMDVFFPSDHTAVLSYRVQQATAKRGQATSKTEEMADTSTWVRGAGGKWQCVMHTESPVQ